MSKSNYTVGTEEGAAFAARSGVAAEVGDTVELDLDTDQERAVVAAGWLEPDTTKKEKK